MRITILLLAAAATLPAQTDTAATKRALLEYDRALAVRIADGSEVGILAMADSNAAILLPGQPILRAADAVKIFRERYYQNRSHYDWRPMAAVASADGQFGCTIGFSTFYEVSHDEPVKGHRGSYVACWRRVVSGRRGDDWKLVALQRADNPRAAPAYWTSKQLPAGVGPASALPIYSSGAPPTPLSGAISADSAFAREAEKPEGPGPAFVHWAADDAWLLAASEPMIGARIVAAFVGWPADKVLLWDPSKEFGYAAGGLAVTVGDAVTRARDGFGGSTNPQKYLTVWRQNADRTWSWIVDLGTPRS